MSDAERDGITVDEGHDADGKKLRPNTRLQLTDTAFREIVHAESQTCHEKTERLRKARLEAAENGL